MSTLACYANVRTDTPGSLLRAAVSDWLGWSQQGAHWKAESCPEKAWGFAHPSHLCLHTQVFVCAAAIKMGGYIPPARADLPLRSSMLLQVSSFSKCSNLASFRQYGNHLLRALSLPGSVPGGEFVSCHVAEFGFIH